MNNDNVDVVEKASEFLFRLLLDRPDVTSSWGENFDGSMLTLLRAIGQRCLEKWLESENTRLHAVARRRGFRIQRHVVITVLTVLGRVSFRSSYLRHSEQRAGLRPMKSIYGVEGTRATSSMIRVMTDFGFERSFAKAAASIEEHYGVTVAETTIGDRTREKAEEMTSWLVDHYDQAPISPREHRADTMLLSMDGCALRVVEYHSAGSLGRSDLPREQMVPQHRWVDTRLAKARRDGDIKGSFVCAHRSFDEVLEQLEGAATRRGMHEDTQLVFLGDGAHGLMEAALRRFPGAQYILDRCHLREHLFEVADHLDIAASQRRNWVDVLDSAIGKGWSWRVINELRTLVPASTSETPNESHPVAIFIRYLQRFEACVHYDSYEQRGWPIGSGEIESGHKQVPQARLKIAGAAWTPENLNNMAGGRALRASGLWQTYWSEREAA